MPDFDHDQTGAETTAEGVAPAQTPADRRDAIYATLTDPKRRHTVNWVASEFADRDVTWGDVEFDRTALISEFESVFDMNQSQAAATLHHSILPQFTDLGVFEYHRESGTIRVGSPTAMEELVDVATAVEEVCDRFDG